MKPVPIDYDAIRKAIIREMEAITEMVVIEEEPETQDAPRPEVPYMSMKIIVPGAKFGDDSQVAHKTDDTHYSDTLVDIGGQRRMTVSFHAYGKSHEQAYGIMSLWQTSLDLKAVQEALRKAGIAVWTIGNVADNSQLLNTGYEGRAQMDCTFGIASNLSGVPGTGVIERVTGTGTVTTDQDGEDDVPVDVRRN